MPDCRALRSLAGGSTQDQDIPHKAHAPTPTLSFSALAPLPSALLPYMDLVRVHTVCIRAEAQQSRMPTLHIASLAYKDEYAEEFLRCPGRRLLSKTTHLVG